MIYTTRKKTIIVLIILSFLIFSIRPVGATDWFFAVKEFGLDLAARAIARTFLRTIIDQLIAKIQSTGRDGGPAFVRDWRSFMLQGQYRGEDIWRGILDIAVNGNQAISPLLCNYIRENPTIKSFQPTRIPNLIKSGSPTDIFQRRVDSLQDVLVTLKCDPGLEQKIGVYRQNFVQGGGWDTFTKLLSAQHRTEGVVSILMDELDKQRKIEEKADINEAIAGSGYTSVRDICKDEAVYGPPSPSKSQCTLFGKILTPGDLIGKTAANTIDQEMGWLMTSDELSEVLIAVMEASVNRLTNLATAKAPDEAVGISTEQSLAEEYCSAKKPGSEAIQKNGNKFGWQGGRIKRKFASDVKFDKGSITPYGPCEGLRDAYGEDNPYFYQRCVTACFKATGIIPSTVNVPPIGELPPEPTPGNGGGGVCSDQGGTADYEGNLRSAIDAVIAENPNGIADALNSWENSLTFLNYAAQELQSAGFKVTTDVLNGNGNPNRGDLIAVWQSGDATVERYDAVGDAGLENKPMREAATTQYTGDIPLSCAGGGGGGTPPEQTPAF